MNPALRPLPSALATLVVGIHAAPSLPLRTPFLIVLMTLCLVAGLLLLRRRALTVCLLLPALALFGVWRARSASLPAPDDVSRYIGSPSFWVLGTVASDIEEETFGHTFVLSVRAVHDYTTTHRTSGLLQVTVRKQWGSGSADRIRVAYGDEVWLRGRVEAPPRATNPGGFDYGMHLARRGIRARIAPRRSADIYRTGRADGTLPGRAAARLRDVVQDATRRNLAPADAALLDGLLLSLRGHLPAREEEAFLRTGTVHILSTSGLHLAVLAGFLSWLLRALSVPHRAAGVACVGVIWVYALAAGAGPAVVRSALMLSVVLLAPLAHRRADPLNSLFFAAFVILLLSPLALYDAGTQLSFAAVAMLCGMQCMLLLEKDGPPALIGGAVEAGEDGGSAVRKRLLQVDPHEGALPPARRLPRRGVNTSA